MKIFIRQFKKLFITGFLLASNSFVFAADSALIVAKSCFLNNNNIAYEKLAHDKKSDLVLFKVDRDYWHDELPNIMAIKQAKDCGKFENVGLEWQEYKQQPKIKADYQNFLKDFVNSNTQKSLKKSVIKFELDENPDKQKLIEDLHNKVDTSRIETSLKTLSDFYNRAGNSTHGVKAAEHLQNKMIELGFKAELISTLSAGYKQPSVIARLGGDELNSEPALVVSAHMDTLGGRMPGADDDGSGVVSVLEVAKIIKESGYTFTRPIYFIFYSAEEMGLVGSKVVVRQFVREKTKVDSVLHLDTIGKLADGNEGTLWLLADNVNNTFTKYLQGLITKYLKLETKYTTCGYACSDHANWTRNGFVSGAGIESSFDDLNPNLHTDRDTLEKVSMEQLANFTKLALAYVVDRAV
jgi:leucyl aminopeptidase